MTKDDPTATYLRRICGHSLLGREEEARLARLGPEGRRELVELNMRMVLKVAHRYDHLGVPLEDLVQEGSVGLVVAASKFDPARGTRFSTYATWWIRQRIRLAVRRASVVRGPLNGKVRAPAVTSLDKEIAGGGSTLGNLLPDRPRAVPPDPELRVVLDKLLRGLSRRERLVVEMRFLHDPPLTLKQAGRRMDLSRERIRQIEVEALWKLRKHGLVDFIGVV